MLTVITVTVIMLVLCLLGRRNVYGGGSAGNNAGGSYGDGDSGGDSGEDCSSNSRGAVMVMVEILKDSVHLIPI